MALLTLMLDGPNPEPTVRGVTPHHHPDPDEHWVAWAGPSRPVLIGLGPGDDDAARQRVWRDGRRLRVEESDGRVAVIADEHTCWQFDRDHDAPPAAPRRHLWLHGPGSGLLIRPRPEEFAGDGSTRSIGPVGATTFLGRPAWTVELAPPPHKPDPVRLVVDAATGTVLRRSSDGTAAVDEWAEFVVGEELDPELFTWPGPVRTPEDQQAELRAEWDASAAPGRAWFAENVTAQPLRVELELQVLVHEYDDVTGAFEATVGSQPIGSRARRPRSEDPWDLRWDAVQHRWATPRWDWALTFFEDEATPDGVTALQRRLGPD